jgi:SlyX protein
MAVNKELLTLEEDVAFQGENLRSLNEALSVQQQDILLLKRQLSLLAAEVQTLREMSGAEPMDSVDADSDEKPPHY